MPAHVGPGGAYSGPVPVGQAGTTAGAARLTER
jgi:hypothetical protein